MASTSKSAEVDVKKTEVDGKKTEVDVKKTEVDVKKTSAPKVERPGRTPERRPRRNRSMSPRPRTPLPVKRKNQPAVKAILEEIDSLIASPREEPPPPTYGGSRMRRLLNTIINWFSPIVQRRQMPDAFCCQRWQQRRNAEPEIRFHIPSFIPRVRRSYL